MRVSPMPDSSNRYHYMRCLKNERSEQYTNVVTRNEEEIEWLRQNFMEVEKSEETLPAWRLYHLLDD